jgi:ComF family protein|tara:strand:+ start:433 stop:951 length:519 start_codon:yes stop_codon:yes gene_type:complete
VKDLPPFTAAFAPLIYQPPVSNWVHAMKFSGHPVYTNILATLTTRYLQERIFDCRPDVLIPVPLSRRRLIRRGHNQALLLAHPLARTLCIPLTAGLVVRNRHTMPQQGLTRTVRLRNLRDVFEVTEAPPAHVAIVDDVMTTTATTTEIARTLLQAGAGRVDVWVAARATLSR